MKRAAAIPAHTTPARVDFTFSKDEVAEALATYARAKGETVPGGRLSVGGLEYQSYLGDYQVTLYASEPVS